MPLVEGHVHGPHFFGPLKCQIPMRKHVSKDLQVQTKWKLSVHTLIGALSRIPKQLMCMDSSTTALSGDCYLYSKAAAVIATLEWLELGPCMHAHGGASRLPASEYEDCYLGKA